MCTTHDSHLTHTGGNMSGNPYDLRAGLLGQAQAILQNQYHQEYERIRYLCDRDLLDATTVTWPKMPTSDEIIAEAEKLYKFVQTK